MFQFPWLASVTKNVTDDGLVPAGLSHSETPGSKAVCALPGIIAAYRVLHRLREPRHPPCALARFLYLVESHPAKSGRKGSSYTLALSPLLRRMYIIKHTRGLGVSYLFSLYSLFHKTCNLLLFNYV